MIIHAVRSDSATFDARYSHGGKSPGLVLQSSAANPPLYESDAGAIGGNRINMDRSAAIARAIVWNAMGIKSVSTSRAISVLTRIKLGVNSATLGIFHRDSAGGLNWGSNRLGLQVNSSNAWIVYAMNEYGQNCLNATNFGTQNVGTSNWVDVVFTWTGDTTSNGAKVYIDGTLLGQATASAALASSFDWRVCSSIWIGGGYGCNNARMHVNEFVVWDEVIDPTSVTLTSGSGSLNGSSRTAFVDVSAFDAHDSTDPGAANVRLSTAYKIGGTSHTGTCAVPTAAQTKIGVSVDATTGSYDGSDRWSDPGEANVRESVAYKANSTSNNKVGTLEFPDAGDVREGVPVGEDEGTLIVPAVSDVREGVAVDDTEGTLLVQMPTTLRGILSYILKFIGASALTDDEFDAIEESGLTLSSTAQLTYEALLDVLDEREAVSSQKERLGLYFEAKGVNLTATPDDDPETSNITIGACLSDAVPASDGKSTVFVGGQL